MLVFVQCWQCQESFQTAVATDEYCPECQLDWARSSDLEKKKKKKKKTAATTETTEQKAAKAAKEAEEKATKKKAEDKAAKAAKKKEAKAAKKKEEEEAKEAEKLQQQDVEQTPAETDKKKPAVFEIGDVVQGCWELDAESNTWEFGTIKSILWDEEPPKMGDQQWAYTIKWLRLFGRARSDRLHTCPRYIQGRSRRVCLPAGARPLAMQERQVRHVQKSSERQEPYTVRYRI